jgi:glycosyltransferase 2 family protein
MEQDLPKTLPVKGLFASREARKQLAQILSAGIGIVLLSWLAAQLDFREALKIVRAIPVSLLLAGFVCYGLAFYLRALRLRLLLPRDQSVRHLFPIVLIHYAALNIIPARLGELSYFYLLKKVNNISTGRSVSNLLLARVFDHITLSFLFLSVSIFMHFPSQWFRLLSFAVSAGLLLIIGLLLLMLAYKETCLRGIQRLATRLRLAHHPLMARILAEMEQVVAAFQDVQVKHHVVKILSISLGIWLCVFGSNYFCFRAFQVHLTYAEVMFSSMCIIFLKLFPLQILSGFGIHETTWVVIAHSLGVAKDIAITSAVGSRVVSLIYLALFGLYGFGHLHQFIRRDQTPTAVENA